MFVVTYILNCGSMLPLVLIIGLLWGVNCGTLTAKRLAHYDPGFKGLYNIDRILSKSKGETTDYSQEIPERNPFYPVKVTSQDRHTSLEDLIGQYASQEESPEKYTPPEGPPEQYTSLEQSPEKYTPPEGPPLQYASFEDALGQYTAEIQDIYAPSYSSGVSKYPGPLGTGDYVNSKESEKYLYPLEFVQHLTDMKKNENPQVQTPESHSHQIGTSPEYILPPVKHTPWHTIAYGSPSTHLKTSIHKYKFGKPPYRPPDSIQSDLLAPVEFLMNGMVKRVSNAIHDVSATLKAPKLQRNEVITGVGGVIGSLALAAGAYYLLVVNGPTPVIHARSDNSKAENIGVPELKQIMEAFLRLYREYEFGNTVCHRRTACQLLQAIRSNSHPVNLHSSIRIPFLHNSIGLKEEERNQDCRNMYPECKASIAEIISVKTK